MSRWLGLVSLMMLAGCPTKNNARYCESSATCIDPKFPLCDVVKRECVATSAMIDLGMLDLSGLDDLSGGDLSMPDLTVEDQAMPPDLRMVMCNTHMDCPNDAMPICDAMSKSCRPCETTADDSACAMRTPSAPKCKLDMPNKGACVQCNGTVQTADCPSATPICTDAGTCRTCASHSDCTVSKICKGNGACIDPGDALYIDNANGTCGGNHAGTVGDPLCEAPILAPNDIPTAGFQGKAFVYYAASSANYGPLQIRTEPTPSPSPVQNLTLVGPGAKLSGHLVSNPVAAITVISGGHSLNITIDGFDLRGAYQDVGGVLANTDGLRCVVSGGNGAINLNLINTTVHDSGIDGFSNSGCNVSAQSCVSTRNRYDGFFNENSGTFRISQCISFENRQDGIDCDTGTLTVDRSSIFNNNDRGIRLSNGPTYTITNNFIYSNNTGMDFSAVGGDGVFQFNTVATNGVGQTTSERGILCETTPTHTIQASIVWGNGTNNGTQFRGSACKLLQVVTSPDSYAGVDVKTVTFVRPSPTPSPDYRLVVGAPANGTCCVDKIGGPLDGGTALSNHDYDGESRPHPTFYDVGADEAH